MRRGEVKACSACSKAKRKCDKQLPSCQRCQDKSIGCNYSAQPSIFVYGVDTGPGDDGIPRSNMSLDAYALCFNAQSHLQGSSASLQVVHPSIADLQSAWFLTPDTWIIQTLDNEKLTPVTQTVLHRHIQKTKSWLQEWVCKGSNSFIHSQLYNVRLPTCIQDAFMAASSYLSKTPETEDMIFRILDERACQLVRSQDERNEPIQDPFESISRLHALVIYQIIRLYDGETRQKYLARQHIPLLRSWASEMMRCTSEAAQNGSLLFSNSISGPPSPANEPSPADQERLLWHSWIIAETARRTWIVSQAVSTIYLVLLEGESDCPGGIMFTTRQGVWEANSAFSWTKTCAERNVGFFNRKDLGKVLSESSPWEVDEFGRMLLELDFGLDAMERWGVDVSQPL